MKEEKEIINILTEYSFIDWRRAEKVDLTKADKTPQFEQDASNCWFYSMCNNAYYNFAGDFRLADLIEVKNQMKEYGLNMKEGGDGAISGAFISRYLEKKRNLPVRCFQIDFFKDTLSFSKLLKKGIVFEMSRINTPLLYTDAHDDGVVNQIFRPYQAKGWHSTNIYFDNNKKLVKELGTWGDSKNNEFYYDVLQFGNNIKTRAISSVFNFLGILDE